MWTPMSWFSKEPLRPETEQLPVDSDSITHEVGTSKGDRDLVHQSCQITAKGNQDLQRIFFPRFKLKRLVRPQYGLRGSTNPSCMWRRNTQRMLGAMPQ
ncbi:hypothetical protein ATANTOWER_005392 [Ataeniobius toweri]|uniref:Uncharacterized protein n=1 Tax=Ataeniobius toweri TaxID=208326 RepID=A0ABU7B654_9TELE|nr:hypothetical protein [Ataeniobius toweri]